MEVQSLQGGRCETAPLRAQEDRKDADIQPCMHAAHCNSLYQRNSSTCYCESNTGSKDAVRDVTEGHEVLKML